MSYENFSIYQLKEVVVNNPKDKKASKALNKRIELAKNKTYTHLYVYIALGLIFFGLTILYSKALAIFCVLFCFLIGFELAELEDKMSLK